LLDTDRDGVLDGRAVVNSDFKGNSSGEAPTFISSVQNSPTIPVTVWTAEEAYTNVLASAGNSRFRDSADQRIISQVQSLGAQGAIIANETQVGAPPTIIGGTPPVDTSHDGVPDSFQTANGFSTSAVIHNVNSGDGYTWLEKYVHSLTDPDTSAARHVAAHDLNGLWSRGGCASDEKWRHDRRARCRQRHGCFHERPLAGRDRQL
jgi:hypothetical protein